MLRTFYIFLDDIRNPQNYIFEDWEIVRDFNQFCAHVETWLLGKQSMNLYISFDHDLGDADTKTGYDCMKTLCGYLESHNVSYPFIRDNITINVHSANPVGRDNINGYWDSFCKHKEQEFRDSMAKDN